MKNLTLIALLFTSLFINAQHAGNALSNGSAAAPNLVPYNQASGVNLTINTIGQSYGNKVSLKADVMMNVLPQAYVVILSAAQSNETFEEADSMMNLRLAKFANAVRSLGITQQDIHIDFISVIPTYQTEFTQKRHSITGNEIATGYELKKNIHVRVKNTDLIDGLVAAAAYAEIYDLVKVDYIVENMDQVYQQLREKAIEIIKMKQLPYTENGVRIKQTDLGETRGSIYPAERYARYQAFKAGTPAIYKQLSKNDVVQINYADKNTTVYYEKVPFGQFDHVINPVVAEPCVQFYFSLQVNYKIIDEDTEARQKEDRDYDLRKREIEIANLKNPPCADKNTASTKKK